MSIDPSGRGKDELAVTIIGVLNGYLFLLKNIGLQGGYIGENLKKIALLAKEYKVNKIVIESNFGDGMFTTLMLPVLNRIHPCEVEEVRHNTQKERRIIDTLEPILNQHKLIVGKNVIKEDIEQIKRYPDEYKKEYSLIYQMTHLTKDRGCLGHDDRLDSLAIAAAACLNLLAVDVEKILLEKEEAEFEKYLQEYFGDDTEEAESNWFNL